MVPSKAKKEEEVVVPEEAEVDAELPEVAEEAHPDASGAGIPASAPGGPVPGRKSLGVKEPIVFKWKVIGRSGSMFVTLFKSVEREEVEAQLERLTRDGYYTHLQILEASAKVEQPPQPKEAKKSAKPKEAPPKAEKPAPSKSAPSKPAAKSPPPKKASPVKASEKSSAKSAKAKPKPSSKRTAKKK